jgi:hypothetical protein
MGLRPFIQWGFLVFLIAIVIFFEAIHLHVIRYNLFLLLMLACTFFGILCLWIVERRVPPPKTEGGRTEND